VAEVKEIRWSLKALRQLDSIGQQIEIDSPLQAKRIVSLLYSTPEKLRWSPRKGEIVPELGDPNLREVTVYSWRLIYRIVDAHTLEVAAIVHGRRLLKRSFLG
jgi:plasmid stabilization system protein ParE